MKYLMVSDFNYIKRIRLRLLLVSFMIVVIGSFFKVTTGYLGSDYIFYAALGLKFEMYDIISFLIFLIQQIIFIILIIDLVSNDIIKNMTNIFSRIDIRKWMMSKLITTFALILSFKTFVYLFVVNSTSLFYSNYYLNNIGNTVIWYLKDILYTFDISLLFFLFYIVAGEKNKIVLIIMLGIFLYLIPNLNMFAVDMNFIMLIFILIILFVLFTIILKLRKENFLERWK